MASFSETVGAWASATERRLSAVHKRAIEKLAMEMTRTRAEGGNVPVDTGNLYRSLLASTTAMPKTAEGPFAGSNVPRSEEHTSELQSRPHRVCRLLLEKKKTTPTPVSASTPCAPADPRAAPSAPFSPRRPRPSSAAKFAPSASSAVSDLEFAYPIHPDR